MFPRRISVPAPDFVIAPVPVKDCAKVVELFRIVKFLVTEPKAVEPVPEKVRLPVPTLP